MYTGGIELIIFSEHFINTEFDVVDIQTQRIDKFGKLSQHYSFCRTPYTPTLIQDTVQIFSPSSTKLDIAFLHFTLACSLSSSLPLYSITGEDMNYSERGFLLYDGIHYDPLVLATPTGAVLQTMFPTTQEGVVYEASEIAREAHQVLPNRNAHAPTHKPVVL